MYILVHGLDTNILLSLLKIIVNLRFVNSIIIDYKFLFMYQHKRMYKITLTPSPRNMFINIVFIR